MEVNFKLLTPLHIGSGDDLNTLDYVKLNSVLYKISQRHFLKFIGNNQAVIGKYNDWLIKNAAKINELDQAKKHERDKRKKYDYNQQLSILRKEFNLLDFIENNTSLKNDFIKFINESKDIIKIKYSKEPKDQIRGFMKNGNGVPYIPGTSIKGAIRTALLFNFLAATDKNIIKEILKAKIQEFKSEEQQFKDRKIEFERNNKGMYFNERFSNDKYKKAFGDKIEQLAFYCQTIDETGRIKNDDDKFDILKFLSVSDVNLEKSGLILANIDLYLVSKEKDWHSGKLEETAVRQPQTSCIEAISDNIFFKADLDFNLEFFLNLKEKIHDNSVKQGNSSIWIGIFRKVKDVFNINLQELTKENIEEKRKEVIEHILNCIKHFSFRQLDFEKNWLNEFLEKDRSSHFRSKINNGYKPIFENKGDLLHFGLGSGFFGLTEFLYLQSDNELKSLLKEVMELFGIGDKPGVDKTRRSGEKYTATPDRFPKSRRLIDDGIALKPLGWVKIISNGDLTHDPDFLSYEKNIKTAQKAEKQALKVEEAKKTHFFTGKLKQGAYPIDAEVVKSGSPNFVRLFIEGLNQPVELRGYSTPLDIGTLITVKINIFTSKNEIKQVGFIEFKK